MHLLIDLDGTLTDPSVGILTSLRHALDRVGVKPAEGDDLSWSIGPPIRDALRVLLQTDEPDAIAFAVDCFRERFADVGLFENEVYPDVAETLERLQNFGFGLHIATSKPEPYAIRIMEHFNLAQYFLSVNGSSLDGSRGDKTELIAHILNEQSISSSAAAMVGDRKHDMIGAVNNGVRAIGVLWGFGTLDELTTAGADTCVDTPPQLFDAVTAR